MGRDKNFCELCLNVILPITICVEREIREWQFSPFFVILSEKLKNVSVISREIAEITRIKHERKFTLKNWSETWFHETVKIAFELEFSVNVNSLTHH